MSTPCTSSPSNLFVVTVVHESLFQISTETTFRLRSRAAASLQGLPPLGIHVHPDHELAFVLVNADIIVIRQMRP